MLNNFGNKKKKKKKKKENYADNQNDRQAGSEKKFAKESNMLFSSIGQVSSHWIESEGRNYSVANSSHTIQSKIKEINISTDTIGNKRRNIDLCNERNILDKDGNYFFLSSQERNEIIDEAVSISQLSSQELDCDIKGFHFDQDKLFNDVIKCNADIDGNYSSLSSQERNEIIDGALTISQLSSQELENLLECDIKRLNIENNGLENSILCNVCHYNCRGSIKELRNRYFIK